MSSKQLKSKDDNPNEKLVESIEATDSMEEEESVSLRTAFSDSIIGKVVEEKYEVESLIGEGGIGNVYKAKHQHLGKPVALKFLAPELVKDKKAVERFHNEAKITCNLSHANIVTVREYGIAEDNPYLIMDYLDGRSIKDVIEKKEEVSEEKFLKWTLQMLDALDYAHRQGVIHRDIKPANIFLVGESNEEEIKVLDFGIAKLIEDESKNNKGITTTGDIFGTPAYMSPEQCHGKHVKASSDIYSLGCVLYEMISHKPPFDGESALEVFMGHVSEPAPKIESNKYSKTIKQVIYKCLEKAPEDRYQSVRELRSDILAISKGEKVSVQLKQPNHIKVIKALVAVIVVLLMVIAGIYFQNRPESWRVYKSEAIEYYNNGDWRNCEKYLQLAIKDGKSSNIPTRDQLDLLKRLSKTYRAMSDFKSSERIDRRYIDIANKHRLFDLSEKAQVELADMEIQNKEYQKAIQDLKTLKESLLRRRGELFPGLVKVYEMEGSCYHELKDNDKAVDSLQKAIYVYNRINIDGYEGNIGIAYWRLSKIHLQKGDISKAYKYIRLAKNTEEQILRSSREKSSLEKRFLTYPVDATLVEIKERLY